MSSTHSLRSLEETLRGITDTFTPDDWHANNTVLSNIRKLTFEPPNHPVSRPSNVPTKTPTTSLEALLELPDNGLASLHQTVSILDKLTTRKSVRSYCSGVGLKSRAIATVLAVFDSLECSERIYVDIWRGCDQFYASNGTTANRLLTARKTISGEADANAARYRVNALLFALHFNVLCGRYQHDGPNPRKVETMVLESLMAETAQSRMTIQDLLKLGRWYVQWVDRLGVGAILLLGQSLATSNNVKDIDRLVTVCKGIPGVCERLQKLLEPAKQAIVGAVLRSGQPLPPAAQPYIDHLNDLENGSGQRYIVYPGSAESSMRERTEDLGVEEASRDEATGLQALVAAADRVETYEPGYASTAAQRQSTRTTQAQPQLRAQSEGLNADHVPGLALTDVGAAPAPTYGQDMQTSWQMHANQDPDAIQGTLNEPHASIANANQVQPNGSGSRADIAEQQFHGATSNMAASNQQLCIEPMQMVSDTGTSWSRGTTLPHFAHNGVETPVYGFYHDGMVSNQDMMVPGQDGGFWSLDWEVV